MSEARLLELERRVLDLEKNLASAESRINFATSSLELSAQAVKALAADVMGLTQALDKSSARVQEFLLQSAATRTAFEEQGKRVELLRNAMESLTATFKHAMTKFKQSGRK